MDDPIACQLSPAQYRERTAELSALASRALLARRQTPDGERLTFAEGEDTERELRAVIAAEASCCSFLRMDLQRSADGLVLTVVGPQDARPIIAELFA